MSGRDPRRAPAHLRLTTIQRDAIQHGRPDRWLTAADVNINGPAFVALARKGLAEIKELTRPYKRLAYKLTDEGNQLRVAWALEKATMPVTHTPIPVRCGHCGTEFPDGTPGGSCTCGAEVHAITDTPQTSPSAA